MGRASPDSVEDVSWRYVLGGLFLLVGATTAGLAVAGVGPLGVLLLVGAAIEVVGLWLVVGARAAEVR